MQYRTLVAKHPEKFLPTLALVLMNLGGVQKELGQRNAALASAQEAVAHLRELAAARPEIFSPLLATGLSTLSVILSGVGNFDLAVEAAKEAVGHCRELVNLSATFRPLSQLVSEIWPTLMQR